MKSKLEGFSYMLGDAKTKGDVFICENLFY